MLIKAYGDTMNDGAVQLSFTLPVANTPWGHEAARLFVLKLGFESCQIVHAASVADGFTMFIAYGQARVAVDSDEVTVVSSPAEDCMTFDEVNDFIRRNIGRKVVVVGACTGSDAHTIGIDAIMNMKGCRHHYGLERYTMVEARNLGAQVPNEKLIEFAVKADADAILVSQIVTQKNVHIRNLTNLVELLEAENVRHRFIVIVGGPQISHKLAIELGFDAGFGKGTYAEHVATFIVKRMAQRAKTPRRNRGEDRD